MAKYTLQDMVDEIAKSRAEQKYAAALARVWSDRELREQHTKLATEVSADRIEQEYKEVMRALYCAVYDYLDGKGV